VEDKRYENHLADASLYAWRMSRHYNATPEPTMLKPHSEEHVETWWDEQAEFLEQQKNRDRGLYGDW
jgi:hypothetical protein